MHALREGWAVRPTILLEARLRDSLAVLVPPAVRGEQARVEWRHVATRMATVRVLEVVHDMEALLRYGAREDAALRAGVDVVAPGTELSPSAPSSLTGSKPRR